MDEMEKTETSTNDESEEVSRFTLLVFLACLMSVGSLAYSTYSFLDLNKVDAMSVDKLGGLSLVGLSAAAAMDIFWSATMVAEYRGRRVMWRGWKGSKTPKNILPLLGWLEVLAIAGMLGYHGHEMGGWAAAFTAILPIATKFVWTLALADIRDPYAPTEEEKAKIAERRRRANAKFEEIKATEAEHKAELEALRRKNERELENRKLANSLKLSDKETDYELKEMELRQENKIKALTETLKTELQIQQLDNRMQVDLMRDEHEREMSLRRPPRMVSGQVISQRGLAPISPMPEIEGAPQDAGPDFLDLAKLGLSPAEQRRAQMARDYYTADAQHGGTVTKTAFAKANQVWPSRVTEATKDYPVEWFVDHGLATWMASQG